MDWNEAVAETMQQYGIIVIGEDEYEVPSSNGNEKYRVRLAGPGGTMEEIMATPDCVTVLREYSCTCDGYKHRRKCRHAKLVANLVADVNEELGYE